MIIEKSIENENKKSRIDRIRLLGFGGCLLLWQFIGGNLFHRQIAIDHAVILRILRTIPEDGFVESPSFTPLPA